MPLRSLTLRGSYVGTLEEMEEVMALGREGKVPPIPLDVRPLSDAPRSLDDLRAGRVSGRVILRPDA
jgi:D-arabinose 1-dehydrogenase-like Zn-dependent alcohol dehydrogenase